MEAKVARIHDLQDGEIREVVVGKTKVLLVRLQGKFYAIGGECTHYGGPLAEGALSGHRGTCPWHQAVFDVMNGDLKEPPALDAEPCYTVRLEGDDVIVKVPENAENRRTPAMVRRNPADDRTLVILGAGAACNAAAETLRQDGFTGRVVMITQESRLPYDRPNLSKGYLSGDAGPETLPWRTPEFCPRTMTSKSCWGIGARVEVPLKTLTFADGRTLTYDALLLATGGVPRRWKSRGPSGPTSSPSGAPTTPTPLSAKPAPAPAGGGHRHRVHRHGSRRGPHQAGSGRDRRPRVHPPDRGSWDRKSAGCAAGA